MSPASPIRARSLAIAAALLAVSPAAAQEAWPARRVTMIVPFGVGSTTDALARYLSELYKDLLGQPFIVENRGGAGGTLGGNAVARAAPDGYTILVGGNTTHSAAPALVKNVPYDPVKDFTPIARFGKLASVLVTNPQQPFRNMQELVAHAKANPGKLTYGHGNSTGQIAGEAIKKRLGLDIARLAYTTTAQGTTDVLTNNIQVMVGDMISGPQLIAAGKLVALATFALQRSALMPNVPTLHETVMPGFEVLPWTGVFGPAGLPAEVVRKMADATQRILARPDAVERLGALGTEPFFAGPEELAAYVVADLPRWAAHAKEAGIEAQ